MKGFVDISSPQVRTLLFARLIRGVADGMMVVGIPLHFAAVGFSVSQVGVLSTAFQVGTIIALLWAGRLSAGRGPGLSLILCSGLMLAAALGFLVTRDFSLVLFFALLGAVNPAAIDATVFRPLEQGALMQASRPADHPALVATHSFLGQLAGALGALLVSAPPLLRQHGIDVPDTVVFVLVALAALPMALLYRRLVAATPPPIPAPETTTVSPRPRSNRLRLLLGLFSIDAFAGGFFTNTLLLVWMHARFDLPDGILGVLFSVIAVCTALAQFLSIPLVRRVGLVWGIILPNASSSVLLIVLALAPTYEVALAAFFVRTVLSVLDVPARSAFVVANDEPNRFAFSLSATNVVMAVSSALGSLVAAAVFSWSLFGWPLIIGACIRFVYVGLLYWFNRRGDL